MFKILSHSGLGRALASAALLAVGLTGATMPAQAEVLDARTTPSSAPAPVISVDPATLPDFALFRECEECPEMVVIPAGSFEMGSPSTEAGRHIDEGPQRRVSVGRFAMSRFETTWAEWEACVAERLCDNEVVNFKGGDNRWGKGRRPVIHVGWDDAVAYAGYVAGRTNAAYRLPSEAEWEYAARGGTASAFPWGQGSSREHANYGADQCCSGLASGRDQWINTAPVGQFNAGPFGLFDMHGNVWEWVEDCHAETYAGAPTNGSSLAANDCTNRVTRGGAWRDGPLDLRSANRSRYPAFGRTNDWGFRLSRTLSAKPAARPQPARATPSPEMVVLPRGSFTMGSPESDTDGYIDEGPQRTVRIGYEFAVGKYEVTWDDWEMCVADGGCVPEGVESEGGDEGWGRGNRPVINVNWDDAQSYIDWLNLRTGLTGRPDRYRLLTEAEWEYAARSGSQARWGYGDDEGQLETYAWFKSNSDATRPVGGKAANGFGLHDLHGNVWEWVDDCYASSYVDEPSDGSARATENCSYRVLRGGSWFNTPLYLRSAGRNGLLPGYRVFDLGFRLARTLP